MAIQVPAMLPYKGWGFWFFFPHANGRVVIRRTFQKRSNQSVPTIVKYYEIVESDRIYYRIWAPYISNIITLWLFYIAMENVPFIDDFPSKSSIYGWFSMAMLNNQRVSSFFVHPQDDWTSSGAAAAPRSALPVAGHWLRLGDQPLAEIPVVSL